MKSFDCDSVLEQLSEFIDADDRDQLCKEIAEHLSRCTDCRVYVDKVKKTIMLFQAGGAKDLPMRATASLQAALSREYQKSTRRGD